MNGVKHVKESVGVSWSHNLHVCVLINIDGEVLNYLPQPANKLI